MNRIIYCSQAVGEVSPDELVEILEAARSKNSESGLTGMLLYSNGSFLQMLEGDPIALGATYTRILQDPRHTNLRKLSETEIVAPLFPDWTMGFEHVDDESLAEELDGFTPATASPLVDPKLVTNAGVAEALLRLYAKGRVH